MIKNQSDYNEALYDMYREQDRLEEMKNMQLKFTKVGDVKSPTRAHETDAGIDFFIPNDFQKMILRPGEDVNIDSGIKVIVPRGYALIFKEKSGVAAKKKLTVGASVVDSDYRGVVHLHMFNNGTSDQELNAGEKIVQGVVVPVSLCPVVEISDDEYNKDQTERADGGFGSTGIA